MKKCAARWGCLALSTISLLFLGTIYAWSIFREPLSRLFPGWSATRLSLPFTLSIIAFCGGSVFSGRTFSRWGSGRLFALSAALLFVGFTGSALSLRPGRPDIALIALCVLYGILGGFGVGIGYNATMSTVIRWFPDHPGLASGTLLMGFGVGGLVLGGALDASIRSVGLFSTFLGSALVMAAILALDALFVKRPGPGALQGLRALAGTETAAVPDVPPSRVLRRPLFWMLCLWLIFTNAGGLLVINSAAPIAVHFGLASGMGLVVSLFNGFGRLFFGWAFDRLGSRAAFVLNSVILLGAGVSLSLALEIRMAAPMFLGLSLVGLSYGGGPSISAPAAAAFWGTEHYAANLSLVNCALIPAALLGPVIASALQERAGGGYGSTFLMLTLLGALALGGAVLLVLRLRRLEAGGGAASPCSEGER